jgi:hypothetical protein
MAVEDDAERERLELEDRLNDLVISLGYGSAYEMTTSRPGSAYLSAIDDGAADTFHPYYLYEHPDGRIAYSEVVEADLKWAIRHGLDETELPDRIKRWYALIGIDHRAGENDE